VSYTQVAAILSELNTTIPVGNQTFTVLSTDLTTGTFSPTTASPTVLPSQSPTQPPTATAPSGVPLASPSASPTAFPTTAPSSKSSTLVIEAETESTNHTLLALLVIPLLFGIVAIVMVKRHHDQKHNQTQPSLPTHQSQLEPMPRLIAEQLGIRNVSPNKLTTWVDSSAAIEERKMSLSPDKLHNLIGARTSLDQTDLVDIVVVDDVTDKEEYSLSQRKDTTPDTEEPSYDSAIDVSKVRRDTALSMDLTQELSEDVYHLADDEESRMMEEDYEFDGFGHVISNVDEIETDIDNAREALPVVQLNNGVNLTKFTRV